jgi:hypothetical protein
MAVDMDKVLASCKAKVGKLTYSMYGGRTIDSSSCDCSGMVFSSMIKHGAKNSLGYIGSTVTEKKFLEENGFELVYQGHDTWSKMKKGDVWIWAPRGSNGTTELTDLTHSSGAYGHTGIMITDANTIHCNYSGNGITIDSYKTRAGYASNAYPGGLAQFVFRQKASAKPSVTEASTTKPVTPAKPQPEKAKKLTVDGIHGEATENARIKVFGSIKAMQKAIGAVQDGIWGKETTKKLQTFLNKKLGLKLAVDGIYGKATTKALQQYLNTKI